MRTFLRIVLYAGVFVVAAAAVASSVSAQTALDSIVSKVNGRIITQSDVNQARLLKLVPESESDDATRTALENRLLILAEIARASVLPPATDEDLTSRRAEWQRALGPSSTDLLGRAHMTDSALDAWLRDDLRVRAYLRRQFGSLPEGDRDRALNDWLGRLRQRAGLK